MSGSGPLRELNRTRKVEAAYQNEYLTRQRVDRIEEARLYDVRRIDALERRMTMAEDVYCAHGFLSRLRWLLLGR
jgi:hypothetical protein